MIPAFFNQAINDTNNPYIGTGALDGSGIPSDFFTDVHIRRAFSWCMDYDRFIDEALDNQGAQAQGPIIADMMGYLDSEPVYSYDLNNCTQEFQLAAADVWNTGFTFQMAYNTGNESRRLLAEIIKNGVEAVNPKFHINVIELSLSDYRDYINQGNFPIRMNGWAEDFHDPHNWVFPFLHSQGAFSYSHNMQDPLQSEFDALIEEAASYADSKTRRPIYETIQQKAQDDAPMIWLSQSVGRTHLSPYIHGWYHNAAYSSPVISYVYALEKSGVPASPELSAPQNNAVLYECQPEFTWSSVSSAESYEIDIIPFGANGTFVNADPITNSYTPTLVLRPDWYYWQAKSWSGATSSDWSSVNWFKINIGAPNNITPVTNDGTYNLTPTFDWSEVCGADGYDLFAVRYDETGTPQTAIYTGTTASEYTPPSDLTPGVYAWYVRAKSGTEYGPWNTFYWLVLFIGAPNLQTPVTNDLVTPYPEFSWTEVAGATGYDLFVVKIEGEGNTTAIYEEYIPTTSYTDSDPLASGIYAWYVRARAGHWVGPLDQLLLVCGAVEIQ